MLLLYQQTLSLMLQLISNEWGKEDQIGILLDFTITPILSFKKN